MAEQQGLLSLDPEEVFFSDVRLNQGYCQTVTFTNNLKATVEATIRAGSSDRYSVSPTSICLKPGQSATVDVRLRVLRFAQKKKAVEQGQRDIFHVKATYFDQKFFATFFLAPEELGPGTAVDKPQQARSSSAAGAAAGRAAAASAASGGAGSSRGRSSSPPRHAKPRERSLSPRDTVREVAPQPRSASFTAGMRPTAAHLASANAADDDRQTDHGSELTFNPRLKPSTSSPALAAKPRSAPGTPQMASRPSRLPLPPTAAPAGQADGGHQALVVSDDGDAAPGFQHASVMPSPRPSAHVQEMLDRQAEALRDKDELLKVMQSRLEVAKQQARSSLPRVQSPGEADGGGFADLDQAEMHIEHLEAVNAQLEGANTQLRSRNQELGSELQGAQEELAALSDLQSQLQHFSPDVERLVETAVARERALQDARNRKVLELLNNKDEVIQRFEARYAEAHAESRQLQASMQDAYKKLDVSEARVADLIEARAKLRKQLDQKQAEFAAMHAAMQAEIAALKGDEGEFQALPRPRSPPRRPADMDKLAAQLRAELEVSKDALAASRQEIHKLSTSLHTANDWIESLQAQVRVQDQSGNEAAKAKDQEIFGLQQQVAELEALLVDEAERHGSGARQPGSAGQAGSGRKGQHGDSLLNVSLDAGIGAAPPGSPSALQRRVHALEAANEKLERALLEANKKRTASSAWTGTAQNGFAGSTAIDTTMDHLRSLLADRDLQIQRLQHELAHAGSSSADEATDLPSDEGALRDSIRSLRRQLADKDALLASNEERLSRLEAVHRVAQETAMASEAQLQQSRSSQAQSDADKEFGKLDAHKARAAAVRLNARVSELTLAEQSARGQLEAAKQELGRVRTAWQAEVAALQQRQKQLKDALQAVVGHTGENTHLAKVIEEAASSAPHGTVSQAAAALDPEVASRPNKAVEDAEVAVAVMQARLLEAEREKREAQQQLADAREAADTERAQLEQAVRRAREEGSVKIASLEDTVRKLSGRSDLHQELARTGGELSTLRRSEARLKSDLVFANERLEEVQRELSMQRSRLAGYEASEHERNIIAEIRKTVAPDRDPAAQAIPAFSLADMSGDPAGQPALIAKLVERAEAAEINASRFQRELEALQRSAASRAAASGAGASAVLSAAQVVEERSAALQRSLVLYESEIKALREEKEVQDLEVARLHAQLAEAAREVAAAQARLVDGERQQHDRSEAAARRGITSNASHWKDIGTAARKQSDAERAAESAQAARQAAEQDLRAAQLEVTRLKAELDAKETLLKRATSQAREDVERATAAAEVAQRECERSTCEAEDRKMQLGVLMETMETLQAGNPGEKEQRIVSLTAQLTAARMKESMLERHSSELRAEAEGHQRQLGMLHAELDKARAAVSEREAQNALDRAAADMLRKEVQGLKTDAKAQAEAVARMGHELDDGRAALEKAEAEMTGLRAALENARSRHFEQLTKERVEASSALRKARTDSFNATASGTATPQPSAGSAKLASGVNELVTLMRSSLSSRRHTQEDVNSRRVSMDDARSDDGMSVGTCASGLAGTDDDVPQRVVQRLKGLIVEAEAQRSHAEADARIAHAEAAEAIRKIRTLEAALEKRTSEWEAALAERETHLVNSARRHMQVAAHAEEKLALQDRRIQALSEQLERANTQLIGLHVMAKHNTSKQTQQKWRVEALQRKLVVAETEIKELEANLAAAVMEAAGTANASNADSVAEAIAARDAGIKAYFEEEVVKCLLPSDPKDKLVALTREVCALKLSQSQLVASQAAAKKRADAAMLQNVSLKQALQATETRLKSFEDRGLTAEMSGQDHVVAELSAQLASKAHEIYKLQEEALHRRQELASHDLQQQELQAGLANAEAAVKQARIDADRAIEQLRVQLSSDFAAEREHLLKELETANQRNKDAIQQIQKDAAQCQEHSNAELDAVREAAEQQLAARPETHEFAEAIDRASAAEARAQQLEADVGRLHDEIDRLQAAIQRGETELTGLRADAEIRGSALASLEETLGKIERSTERAAGSSSAPLGGVARRVSVSSRSLSGGASSKALNVNGGDLSLGALSRQLVNAKMAEADALRKLRVSARAEVELRQRLAQKEDRITELKETLSTKASQYDDLKRRYEASQQQRTAQLHSAAASTRSLSALPESGPRHHRLPPRQPSRLSMQHPAVAEQEPHAAPATVASQPHSFNRPPPTSHAPADVLGRDNERPAAEQGVHTTRSASSSRTASRQPSSRSLQPEGPRSSAAPPRLTSPEPQDQSQQLSELCNQIADLRIELAKRDAEIDYLEGALAQANAQQVERRPDTPRSEHSELDHMHQELQNKSAKASELRRTLRELQRECAEAAAAARSALGQSSRTIGRATTPPPAASPAMDAEAKDAAQISNLVDQLITRLKEKEASAKRLRVAVKTAQDKHVASQVAAAAQPLEASQRAVIRDLSLKVSNLTRLNNQLKADRERAQERLRTLRASLGSTKIPQLFEPLAPADQALLQLTGPATAATTQPGAPGAVPASGMGSGAGPAASGAATPASSGSAAADFDSMEGLCRLLEHHLNTLEQAQQPVSSMLKAAEPEAPDADAPPAAAAPANAVADKQVLAQVAASSLTEVSSMRSVLHVLCNSIATASVTATPPAPSPEALSDSGSQQSKHRRSSNASLPRSRRPSGDGAARPEAGPPQTAAATERQLQHEHQQHPLALPANAATGPPAQASFLITREQAEAEAAKVASQVQEATMARAAAEQADQAKRLDKWKHRCAQLRQELAAATTATAALEAALNERLYAAEKNIEECVVRHRVEVSRLEAALAGADAARAELAAQASRTTVGMTDLRAALAKAAEGEARAEALQKQIDTLRAQSNASRAGLQEEVQALSAALAQEKGERARIVMSLRDTIGGLKQAGDVEGRLKAELIQLHEQLATARAAQEQAEAKASQRRSEAKAAKNKLEALREELNQRIAAAELADHAATLRLSEMQQAYGRLESRLAGMDAKRAELEAAMLARMDTIAAQIAADTQGPPDLVAGVEALERSAHEMDTRFHELEARAEVLGRHKHDCAAVKWESLLRARRYRSALQQVKGELQAATFDKTSVAGEVDKAQAAARAAEAEAQELCRRMEEMQRHHESERQKLAERHAAQLCEVESRIEEERGALRQEALAMAASAAAAAEDRGRAAANIRLCETEQRALKDVTNAHSEQRRLADELDTLRAHFKAYQQVKCQEVAVLEARLRQCLQQRPSQPGTPSLPASPLRIPTDTRAQKRRVPRSQPSLISGGRASARGLENMPADEAGGLDPSAINMGSEVAAAVEAESVMAALREAEFERLQREAAEDMLNAMQESVEKLKQKLKQAQKDAKVARDGSAATAANAMDRPSKEEFDQLKEQTAGLQGTLKAVRAESSRRLAALQALQQQVGPDGTPIPPQALAGEREARESAERALQQAKHAVQRKGQLVADLKKRVSELEEALDKAAQSHSARDAEAAEGRIRSLQATVARKEEAIRDLKAQVDQLTRATLQKAADQDSERLQAATKKLKGDLARKDALLRAAQADLDKVREEATAAMRSAESASKREARAWREAGTDIAIVRKRALAVLDALRALARLALRSVAAMSAAASTASAAQMAPAKPSKAEAPRVWDAVTADAIAKMVDMSPAEVQDVLGATGSRSGESASAEVAHDVAALLLQLESTLTAGVADAAQRFADPEAGGREPGEGSDSGSLRSFTVRAPDQTQWKAACLNRLVEQLEGESRRAEALLANALAHLPNMEGKAAASWVARQASRAQHPGRRSQSDTVSKLEAELRRASKGIEADLGL